MNQYLLALIGLVAMLIVGAIFFGALFKETIASNKYTPSAGRIVAMIVAMYLLAIVFIMLFTITEFPSDMSNTIKGLYLGLMVGVPFLAFPLFIDGPYFKTKESVLWVVVGNWIVSFVILGLIVGALI